MQVPEKNIKGLSLLELVVVLVLIGVVTAVAYPDFTEWNRERKVRNGADRVLAFMKNIHSQTERGTFAYVQVLISDNGNALTLTSKGMTMQDLTDKIHDGSSDWNGDPGSRCAIGVAGYWSTDTAGDGADIKNYVFEVELEGVTTTFSETTAVCFARNGKFFEAGADTHLDSGIDAIPKQYLYICRRGGETCSDEVLPSNNQTEKSKPSDKISHLRAINFGRFGNFSISKFLLEYDSDSKYDEGASKWIN